LVLHSAGEDPKVLNQPIDFLVRPLSYRADWDAVQNGYEPRAKTVIVCFVSCLTIEINAVRVGRLPEIKMLIHNGIYENAPGHPPMTLLIPAMMNRMVEVLLKPAEVKGSTQAASLSRIPGTFQAASDWDGSARRAFGMSRYGGHPGHLLA
jgi:hypothetical protein